MSDPAAISFAAFLQIRSACRYVFIAVCLIGGFSLQRIWPSMEVLGPLAEPRFVLAFGFAAMAVLGWCGGAGRLQIDRRLAACGILFLGLHLYVASSYLWSHDPWFASQQLEDLSLLLLTMVAFVALFGDAPLLAVRVILQVSLGLAVLVGVLSAASGFEEGAYGIGGIGAARLYGTACLAVLFLRYETGRVWLLLLLLPMLAGMLVSGSRASLLALLPAMALLWLLRARVAGDVALRARPAVIGAACVLIILVALGFTPVGSDVASGLLLALFGSPATGGGVEGVYLADRDVIFSHAWRSFLDSPLAGLGIGTYRGPFGEEYPHNLLLVYAVDAGVAALLMLCGLLAVFLVLALRVRTPLATAATVIALFTLVASMFAGSYYDARVFWLMSAALAMQAWMHVPRADQARMRVQYATDCTDAR